MKKQSKQVFTNITMGMQLAVTMLLFVYIGYRLDVYYDKMPLFLCLGTFIGFAAGLYNLLKELRSFDEKKKHGDTDNDDEESNKWL